MNAQTWVALGAALLAATVAVTVPMWTFRRTLEHERIRWVRDQRADLYADMLTEAFAEHRWFMEQMSRIEIAMIKAEDDDPHPSGMDDLPSLPDVRMKSAERAKLGSRGTLFASKEVTIAFNMLQGHMGRLTLLLPKTEGEAYAAKLKAGELLEAFQETVRKEIGADEI